MQAVASASVHALTTPGLAAFRDLLTRAQRDRGMAEKAVMAAAYRTKEAADQLGTARSTLEGEERRLARLEASFFKVFRRGAIAESAKAIEQARHRVAAAEASFAEARSEQHAAEQRRDELWINTEFQLPPAADAAWSRVQEAFTALSRSARIWDITAFRSKATGAERSTATRTVERSPTTLSTGALPLISSRYSPLRWHNANGGDLFLYPGFLIVLQANGDFAMLELGEADVSYSRVRFQESEAVPPDSERVGTTWTYTNRNGTPDRRYAHNPEVLVMLYGDIHWTSRTGLNEAFQFSNAKAAEDFARALLEFQGALKG